METTQLLLPIMGLGLLSVLGANQWPPMIPASSKELLGKWYIISWAGNMPIPVMKKSSPLPPFTFIRNNLRQLEFRMNIRKGHYIFIHFLAGKDHAIAYYESNNVNSMYKMMMLMGRAPDENPGSQAYFEEFVARKGLNIRYVIYPPQDDACELTVHS